MSLARVEVLAGAGGVGKTTVAAATAVAAADAGYRTLVMTFDPSRRLKDTLGIGSEAAGRELAVAGCGGRLHASLLDAQRTFDEIVERHAPDAAVRQRILGNRYYRQLAGSLAGILEYMAVEKLFEVVQSESYDRIVLDTPPTSQALDLFDAPQRIVSFLDSGAVGFATRRWFDERGRLRATGRLGGLGRRVENYLDGLVGLDLLRDIVEFFQAFKPLFEGFRQRAIEVESLLTGPQTSFTLVTTASEDRIEDTMFLARRLLDSGMRWRRLVVNRLHPKPGAGERSSSRIWRLASAVAEREQRALASVRELLGPPVELVGLPLHAEEPTTIDHLRRLGGDLSSI